MSDFLRAPSSPRANSQRVFQAREAPSRRISTSYHAHRASNQEITTDEIVLLKREKMNLIKEKSLLKAKIVRLGNLAKKPRSYVPNINTSNSLEREVRQVEQLAASKRAEIAQLLSSDRAAIVAELQEECIMLHEELERIRIKKSDASNELKLVTRQLLSAREQFSPEIVSDQQKLIKKLEKEISVQRGRNLKIRAKLDEKMAINPNNSVAEAQEAIQQTISALEEKIAGEQEEIETLNKEITGLCTPQREE